MSSSLLLFSLQNTAHHLPLTAVLDTQYYPAVHGDYKKPLFKQQSQWTECYFYVFAACALLLQCLQSTSTECTERRDHVPLDLRLLQQWASLAVVAYWPYLLAANAATTIRMHGFA